MGINNVPRVAVYWKDDPVMGNEGIKQIMPRNRFQEILQFLHFARGEERYDHLCKVQPIQNAVLKNSQQCYPPAGTLLWKGRLSFRQYLPVKPTKYSIKVWMATESKIACIVNFDVYLGNEEGVWRLQGHK